MVLIVVSLVFVFKYDGMKLNSLERFPLIGTGRAFDARKTNSGADFKRVYCR